MSISIFRTNHLSFSRLSARFFMNCHFHPKDITEESCPKMPITVGFDVLCFRFHT